MRSSFIAIVAGLALVASAPMAEAQFKGAGKYAAGIVEFEANTSDFSFDKEKSKVQIKPSKKDGDGGFVIQLNAKFIDCPPNNDKGKAGKCGENTIPQQNHIMELNLHVLGALPVKTGLRYDVEKGKAAFESTGKNKTPASTAGALVSVLYTTSIGVDGIRLRTPGSDVLHPTTGCDALPLPPVNTCADGLIYGIAGFRAGEDLDTTCTTALDCEEGGPQPTLICVAGACVPEPCNADSDCDQNGQGSGGSGQCNCNTNECCTESGLTGCDAIC